jgi:hypothetical protein
MPRPAIARTIESQIAAAGPAGGVAAAAPLPASLSVVATNGGREVS